MVQHQPLFRQPHTSIIPGQEPESTPGYEFLSDRSERDRIWDERRSFADAMAAALRSAGLQRPHERVRDCAEALFFALTPDEETGEISLKLRSAAFCHYRHCPICQWRRSLKSKALFLQRIPSIEAETPAARWLMLTLTVRNCRISDLRATIGEINDAWRRLIKRTDFDSVLGWVRALEVTRGQDGSAHPHVHALLMVKPSYFSHGYIPTERWAKIWRECLRADYDPICDARAVRPKVVKGEDGQLVQSKAPLQAAAAEVLKYSTKGSDLLAGGPEWLAEYVHQMHGVKALTSGGVLKGIFKDEPVEDLVHVEGDEAAIDSPDAPILRYDWRRRVRRYARKRGADTVMGRVYVSTLNGRGETQ